MWLAAVIDLTRIATVQCFAKKSYAKLLSADLHKIF